MAQALRKGWCPGVLRPMPSGDGLLVRLRLTAGELPAATARALAELAERHGNGLFDLSQRANLQMRGVREESLPDLTRALDDLGLLDETGGAEAVRNVMVSPLAGLDPSCADGRPLGRELERRLRTDRVLRRLPAKFGFAIDGGGLWPLGGAGSDLGLLASGTGPWRIRLAGSPVCSYPVEVGAEVDVLVALAHRFAVADLPRMRDLVARDGAAAILAQVGLRADSHHATPISGQAAAGVHVLAPGCVVAAIGLPFGRIDSNALARIADGSNALMRLTPWRLLLAPAHDETRAAQTISLALGLGLAVARNDQRLLIEACPGAPGCPRGSTPTREDAMRLVAAGLANGARSRTAIHVSGCAKGCAHRGEAGITLIGRDGRYDLVLNGGVDAPPVRAGLSRDELPESVAAALKAIDGPI